MRRAIVVLSMLFGLVTSAMAQLSIGIGVPGLSIGINVPVYPQLVRVPGYPVYYAAGMQSNYFFYDGMYWVYQGDNWYASSWYNGPWGLVAPEVVPVFVLRVPVRYYHSPPPYFRGWQPDRPPRWGDHWGNDWQQRRSGWDRWDRRAVPAPAPLPTYQRKFPAARYPQPEQQQPLHSQNYRYQPRDAVVRQHYQAQAPQQAPAPPQRRQQGGAPAQHTDPQPPGGAPAYRQAPGQTAPAPRAPAVQDQRRQPPPAAAPRAQQPPDSRQKDHPQDRGAPQERQRKDEKDKER